MQLIPKILTHYRYEIDNTFRIEITVDPIRQTAYCVKYRNNRKCGKPLTTRIKYDLKLNAYIRIGGHPVYFRDCTLE